MSDKLLTNCGSGDKYYPVFHGEPGTTKPFRPLDLIIKRPQPILKRPSSKMEIITLDELENHEVVITKITQEDVLVRFAPAASDLAYRFSENCTNAHKFCYKDKMHTPLHEHDLQQVDPLIVYGAFQGRWKCDNCNGENSATSHPFHCSPCSFDLCYSCVHTNLNENSLAHQHQLFYLETSRLLYQNQNGVWRCAVCKKTSDDLRETFSYHCASCADFGICRSCFEPRQHPIHSHVLQLVDTSLVYMQSGGSWVCDICDRQSRPYEKFSHHCVECEFDVCLDCFKPQTSPLHSHPLYKANSHDVYAQFNGGWRCDHCASVHNNPLDNHPWHCPACEYDLCQNCMGGIIEAADQTGPSPVLHQIGRNRSFQTQAGIVSGLSFYRRPEENPWLTRDQMLAASEGDEVMSSALTTERGNAVAYPEDTDDNSKCIICMEEPKNATVIHGDTGHCCCCWQCAQVLRMRGDPCPICRAPIDHVIRQFNA